MMTRQVKVPDDPFDLLSDEAFFELPVAPPDDFSFKRKDSLSVSSSLPKEEPDFLFSPTLGLRSDPPKGPRELVDSSSLIPPNPTERERIRPRRLLAMMGGGALLLALILGIYWLTPKSEEEANFAYLEMRAIGPQGRPVAGAVVKQGDALLGHTDSFGEWRRYMKVKMGQTFVLSVTKKTPEAVLMASKNIAIPAQMPKSGELEIKTQIGLLRQGYEADEPMAVRRGDESDPHQPELSHKVAAEPALKPPVAQKLPEDLPKGLQDSQGTETKGIKTVASETQTWSEATGGSGENDDFSNQSLAQRPQTSQEAPTKPALWIAPMTDSKTVTGGLSVNALATSLKIAFEKGGYLIREDAPLVLSVGALHHQGMGLIYARAHLREDSQGSTRSSNKQLFSFLRGNHSDIQSGTEDIIRALSRYGLSLPWSEGQAFCQTAVPCSVLSPPIGHIPPLAQWQKMRFKAAVPLGEQTEVFVSGFAAKHLGGQIYEFWAPPSGPTNVTLIQGLDVIHRDKLTPSTQQVFTIPQTLYARIGLPKKSSSASSKM